MPARRHKLTKQETEAALEALKTGREAAIVVCRGVRPQGPEYCASVAVLEAIDDLAVALGKPRDHFHLKGHG